MTEYIETNVLLAADDVGRFNAEWQTIVGKYDSVTGEKPVYRGRAENNDWAKKLYAVLDNATKAETEND